VNIGFCRRWSWMIVVLVAAVAMASTPNLYAQVSANDQPEAPAAGELKNVAVVAGAPWEKLIADISFLGALGGKPEAGQMVEGGFSFFTQGKGPNAIEKKQPWGVIVQTDGANFLPVACVPVTKPNDLLEVAKGYGAEIKDADNGAKQLVMPNKRSFFVKVDNGMAFVSVSAASLAKLPQNPQQILAKMVGNYDIAAFISVRNVPEQYRQFALQAMKAGAQAGLKKKDDESDEQFAQRQKMAEMQMEQMKRMLNEVDNVKIGWAVDSQQQRTYADFAYAFLPDSKMAKQLSGYGEPKTNFAGFYQPDAAATVTFATNADPKLIAEDMAQMDASLSSMKDQISAEIDKKVDDADARAALKAALGDWLDAVAETVKSGQIDGGGALQLSADSLTLLAGVHVKDTAKIESGLKKLEAAGQKRPDFPGIKWNAANHAGVTFHTMTVPVPEDKRGPRQLLGENLEVAVGLGPETAYLAIGKNNIEAISKAIDASAAEPGKKVPPVELAVSLGPIMEAAAAQTEDDNQKVIVQKVADFLRNEAQGRDHIRMVGQMMPNGLKYHIEAEEGVLKAIGKAATAAQEQRLQANQ
jgi:hypothetical protein